MNKLGLILIAVLPILKQCKTVGNVCLDVNDILSTNWMPGTLLEKMGDDDVIASDNKSEILDGSIRNALQTMNYHRSMMNQFMCRSYVANQIASEITKKTAFKRRIGEEQTGSVRKQLMSDEGSVSYETWLRKSATLEDILKHLNQPQDRVDEEQDSDNKIKTKADQDYQGIPDYMNEGLSQLYEPHPTSYSLEKGKEGKLADVFEIALTALAYLSFGMFLIHLIMSISAMNNPPTTTLSSRIVKMPFHDDSYESDESAAFSGSSDAEDYSSKSEDAESTRSNTTEDLSRVVLAILDAAIRAVDAKGRKCLQNVLCSISRSTKSFQGKTKLFLGFLSFGASWLSNLFSNGAVPRKDGLHASILGFGQANCDNVFVCDRIQF